MIRKWKFNTEQELDCSLNAGPVLLWNIQIKIYRYKTLTSFELSLQLIVFINKQTTPGLTRVDCKYGKNTEYYSEGNCRSNIKYRIWTVKPPMCWKDMKWDNWDVWTRCFPRSLYEAPLTRLNSPPSPEERLYEVQQSRREVWSRTALLALNPQHSVLTDTEWRDKYTKYTVNIYINI